MRSTALQALADDIASARRVSAEAALALRHEAYADGVVCRGEAEVLIALSGKVANSDPTWAQCFGEMVCDHMLAVDGVIADEDAAWLMAQFDRDLQELELDALVKVLERAEFAPEPLFGFVRQKLMGFMGDRALKAGDVALLRRCVYAGDAVVADEEAQFLFDLDARTDGRANDPSWQDLFVKTQLNHLMGRRPSTLLDAESVTARMAFLHAPPQGVWKSISRIWRGGIAGYKAAVRSPGDTEALEDDYWALNENTEEDAKLTAGERRWAEYAANGDGKLTANERALLAELQALQTD